MTHPCGATCCPKASPGSEGKLLLIPELSAALKRYGRELQHGEEENLPLPGGVPKGADFSWEGVILHVSDLGPRQQQPYF